MIRVIEFNCNFLGEPDFEKVGLDFKLEADSEREHARLAEFFKNGVVVGSGANVRDGGELDVFLDLGLSPHRQAEATADFPDDLQPEPPGPPE